MTCKLSASLIASFGLALILAPGAAFGQSAVGHGGRSASAHSAIHHFAGGSTRRHNRANTTTFWPGTGAFFYGTPAGEVKVDNRQPISGDIHYTYTYDVPWDAVHRYPIPVSPVEPVVRPYVPGCPAQAVTVPMADGKEQTINIVRCY
jgi:hypothetical protein